MLSARTKAKIVRLLYRPRIPRDLIFCWYYGLSWDASWRFYGLPDVRMRERGSITIGRDFLAVSCSRNNVLGVFQKVTLTASTRAARITIGNNVGISGATLSAAASIIVGDDVMIGSGALIVDNDAHPVNPFKRHTEPPKAAPVKIGNMVFIGARAIVLKGIELGEGAVVGAGAVVTRSVKPFAIVAGNPAAVVGDSRDR